MSMSKAIKIGKMIGRAIARDVMADHDMMADGMTRKWTGLSPEDGDQLTAEGILRGTPEWETAEDAAQMEYDMLIGN